MIVASNHVLGAEIHQRTDRNALEVLQEQGVLARDSVCTEVGGTSTGHNQTDEDQTCHPPAHGPGPQSCGQVCWQRTPAVCHGRRGFRLPGADVVMSHAHTSDDSCRTISRAARQRP